MRERVCISNEMARVFNQYQLPKSVLSNKTANIMPYLGRVPFEQVWIELATIACLSMWLGCIAQMRNEFAHGGRPALMSAKS